VHHDAMCGTVHCADMSARTCRGVDERPDLRELRVAPLRQRPPVRVDQRPLPVVQQPVGPELPRRHRLECLQEATSASTGLRGSRMNIRAADETRPRDDEGW